MRRFTAPRTQLQRDSKLRKRQPSSVGKAIDLMLDQVVDDDFEHLHASFDAGHREGLVLGNGFAGQQLGGPANGVSEG